MELKKVAGKSLIYDGVENNFYKEFSISLENGETFSFSPMNVIYLEDFEKQDKRNFTDSILKALPNLKKFAPTSDFIYFKNEDDITPYIKEDDKYLIVVSLGETQPARYKIYVEAVFLK